MLVMRASFSFLVDVARGSRRKSQRDRIRLCFAFPVAVEDALQSLWSDIREAAHGSASGLQDRVFRDDGAEVDR